MAIPAILGMEFMEQYIESMTDNFEYGIFNLKVGRNQPFRQDDRGHREMLNYCRKDLYDCDNLNNYIDPDEKEEYTTRENRGMDRQEYSHHTMESEYLSRLNKDLGEVFRTNCSQIAPYEQIRRQNFFTNKYEQEYLEEGFEKEFSQGHPSTMHP